jgi:asparagine synthase (glutamine-hydrolysing)
MCGIAGYVTRNVGQVSDAVGKNMMRAIRYRGRDDCGDWTDGCSVRLLHARLSIIALVDGHQPMTDADNQYTIVFNGEIYNYLELRCALEREGARFRTRSDTEVILEGYKRRGPAICNALYGMFAFALWDSKRRELFLARDRLGKKPLYWCRMGERFYFASTLDAFTEIPEWTGKLSAASLALYGALCAFPGDRTAYQQARAVPPGCHARMSVNALIPVIQKYWRMNFGKKARNITESSALDEYEAILTDAIRLRLRADVPIALTYSGGVDSGTIAALCAKKLGAALDCFTIDYDAPEDRSAEVTQAKAVAELLCLRWRYLHFCYHTALLRDLARSYAPYDQPSNQLALVYSQHLYAAIAPCAKVVLSGNGADELFAGYIGSEIARQRDLVAGASSNWRTRVLRYIWPVDSAVSNNYGASLRSLLATRVSAGDEVAELEAAIDTIVREADEAGVTNQMDLMMFVEVSLSTTDANYRLPDISGLNAQVEVRSPYLDHRMVEFAARLPHRFKVADPQNPRQNKYLPKMYYERLVGRDLAWSAKKGMGYNLRWDKSIASDPAFLEAFAAAYDAIDRVGIDSEPYRKAWTAYIDEKRNGIEFPPSAEVMMNGFMLGEWLKVKQATVAPLQAA